MSEQRTVEKLDDFRGGIDGLLMAQGVKWENRGG